MKKCFALAALAISLALLSACGTNVAGIALSANWYSYTANKNITETREELSYSVLFDRAESESYGVDYDEGTYTTLLEDFTNTAETAVADVPVGFHGYRLHTELTISGRYYLNGTATKDFTDSVVSDCYFYGVTDGLRPVKSVKKVRCTAPASVPTESAYCTVYDYVYTALYNGDLTETTITYQDLGEENAKPETTVLKIKDSAVFFDNEEILFAIRAMDLGASISIRTVNPATRQIATLSTTEAPVSSSREFEYVRKDGETEEKVKAQIETASVTVRYGGINSGSAQTYVYAKCVNPDANTHRNVLLEMTTSAINSMGTFTYTLKTASFTK